MFSVEHLAYHHAKRAGQDFCPALSFVRGKHILSIGEQSAMGQEFAVMITPEEFLVRWGEDDFLHYSPDVVSSLNIPESSKRYLLQIGMPKQDEGTSVIYVAVSTMPLLPKYLSSVTLPPDCARYRLLAEGQHQLLEQTYQMLVQYQSEFPGRWPDKVYSRHYICLDEQRSGQVVWINGEEYSVYLLNTSYEKFAEMQLLLREEKRWLNSWMRSYSEDDPKRYSEEYYQHGRKMLAAICNVDPEAIEESESWTEIIADVQEPYS